jgi:transcriptional regulator with XRE-family HTH domain
MGLVLQFKYHILAAARRHVNVTAPPRRFNPEKLRELRDARMLSRRALADLCPSVSKQAIQIYEEGSSIPTVDRLLEIAGALTRTPIPAAPDQPEGHSVLVAVTIDDLIT